MKYLIYFYNCRKTNLRERSLKKFVKISAGFKQRGIYELELQEKSQTMFVMLYNNQLKPV